MAERDIREDRKWARLAAGMVATSTGHGADRLMRKGARGAALKQARWMTLYLAHTSLGWSQARVAAAFGITDRTVGRACQAIEDDRDDPLVDAILAALDRSLREIVAVSRAGRGI